jgi:chromosome segregation ATPase
MSTGDSTSPKDDFLSQIWTILTTLTEEAMAAALRKGEELGFDPNRGIVPLQEGFVNLASARDVLEDAITKQKLIQLPISVQREILSNLQAISKSLQGLSAGTDEVVNISNSIETLNTSIWKYGLHNLSGEVLGYQQKLNQIKNLEVALSRARTELKGAQKAAEQANSAATEIEQKRNDVALLLEQVRQSSASSTTLLEQLTDAGAKASALFATIQQHEKQSGELFAGIKTANNELLALDASIKKFYGEVEEYRNKINQTSEEAAGLIRTSETNLKQSVEDSTAKVDAAVELLHKTAASATAELTTNIESGAAETQAQLLKTNSENEAALSKLRVDTEARVTKALDEAATSSSRALRDADLRLQQLEDQLNQRSSETIEVNKQRTDLLVEELAKLKDQIKEQIQQATGFRLFGAFQSRQNEIAKAKNVWVYAIGFLVLISAGVTVWIAHEAQYYTANSFAFWIKLSLTVPLAFAITFCTVQYSRERRLEEEYAFKSSISVSLNPYRDLIQSILKDAPADQTKYADFVIDSVRNVFTPPTDKVFDQEHKPALTAKVFKQTAEIIGTAVKAAK